MKIKEIKRIDTDKIRNMCIRYNWYTKGTNADYDNMFKMCEKDSITTNQIFKIAKDIYEHTDKRNALNIDDVYYDDSENILNMMIYVNDCTYVFYKMVN